MVTSWIRWRSEGHFEFEAKGEAAIKGKEERVPLCALRAPRFSGKRNRLLARLLNRPFLVGRTTELAVALKYEVSDMDAPLLVAKGAGHVAARIRDLAAEHGIPLIENKPLAQMLYRSTEVSQMVPEDSYVAVAEILAYVYQITGRHVKTTK